MDNLYDYMVEGELNHLEDILCELAEAISEGKLRKTVDYYELLGDYGKGWEVISGDHNLKNVKDDLKSYRDNEGGKYKIVKKRKKLQEGVTDFPADSDMLQMFDEAIKRLEAARRGLGITNKLPPGEEKRMHRSRIMGNLNRLRALVDRLVKTADSENYALSHQKQQMNRQNTLGQPDRDRFNPQHR